MIGTCCSSRYDILDEIGRGGMGVVYRAKDRLLEREVALKMLSPLLLVPEAKERFRREALLVAQMDHPGLVGVYDLGEHEGSLFLVMPLVRGRSLRALFEQAHQEPLAPGTVLDLVIQAAEGLHHCHQQGVLHRDIKPENLLVEDGPPMRARLTDFGLAVGRGNRRITSGHAILGTLDYLSPEQILERPVDARSDLYSLGVVLYEGLTGHTPFAGSLHLLYQIAHAAPPEPSARGAKLPRPLETFLLACLDKDPDRRPQDAHTFAEVLRQLRDTWPESAGAAARGAATFAFGQPLPEPLVGRGPELDQLKQRLAAAQAGECQLVLLGGEAGIGKSRLMEVLESHAKAEGFRVLHGRFRELASSFAFHGYCEMLQEYFRLARGRGLADFSDLSADLKAHFPILAEIPELRVSHSGEIASAPQPEDPTALFELLARALARAAGDRPLALMLEDLHGADVSIQALEYILRRLGALPILVVASYRPSEAGRGHPLQQLFEAFQGQRRFLHLALGPLGGADFLGFLEGLLEGRLEREAATRLLEATGGNPYFAKEIVRNLKESGGLTQEDAGTWTLSAPLGEATAIPATVQQALERRIQRLPEGARDVLGVASVLGRNFEFKDLDRLCSRPDLEDQLEALVAGGFLEEDAPSRGERLRFPSPLLRDVVYGELGRRRRRTLHRQHAEQLERRGGPEELRLPMLLHHCFHGDVPEKAVHYGLQLAQRHLEDFSVGDARSVLRMVLQSVEDLTPPSPALEGKARLFLAQALRQDGEIQEALREAERAQRAFDTGGLLREAEEALRLGAETAFAAQRSEEALHWVRLALDRIQGPTDARRRLLHLGATLANLRGDFEAAGRYQGELDRLGSAAAPGSALGGRLRVGLAAPLEQVLPALMRAGDEEEALCTAFEPLIRAGEEGHPVPWLAERWELRDEGRAFRIHLRQDVKLHDGRALIAERVAEAIRAALAQPGGNLVPAWAALQGPQGVQVVTRHCLELRLATSLPIYAALLTDGRAAIALPDPAGGLPLGTGPFRLVEASADRRVLARFEGYWRSPGARVEALEFQGGLGPPEMVDALRDGRLDLVKDLPPEDLEALARERHPRRPLVEAPKPSTYFLLFTEAGPWSAHAPRLGSLPLADLVRRHLGRQAQPAQGLFPPGFLGHDPARRLPVRPAPPSDPFPATPLRVAMHPIFQQRLGAFTQAILEHWRAQGAILELLPADPATYWRAIHGELAADALFGRWLADYPDPDSFCFDLFHSEHGHLKHLLRDPGLDRLAEEGRALAHAPTRERLYARFDTHLKECGRFVPLAHDVDVRVCAPAVRGARLAPAAPFLNYAEVQVVPPSAEPGRPGGVLAVPIAGHVTSLDPSQGRLVPYAETLTSIYEPLTREGETSSIVPWLAEEFEALDGGRRFRFRLRSGLRFQDGRPVTTRDVRYSFERLLQSADPEALVHLGIIRGAHGLGSGGTAELEGFHLEGPHTFSLELSHPTVFLPAVLSFHTTSIIPEGSRPGVGTWKDGCLGTGPFRVTAFEPGRRLEVEANPFYWREGLPKVDRMIFHFGVDPAEQAQGFRTGRYAFAANLPSRILDALRQDRALQPRIQEVPELSTYYLAFNARSGPCANPELRQRLRACLPVERLVRRCAPHFGLPARTFIPPSLLGSNVEPRSPAPRSPEAITALCAPLKVLVSPSVQRVVPEFVDEVLQRLEGEGFPVHRLDLDQEAYLAAFRGNAHDLLISRWIADYPDPDNFAHTLFHSQRGLLKHLLGDPELDQLIDRGRRETDHALRQAIYLEIESLLHRKTLLVPFFHELATRLARPEIEGFQLQVASPHIAYEQLSVRRG